MIRFELVITRWEDGLFKSIDRSSADNLKELERQFEFITNTIRVKMVEEQENKYKIADDDDIPF